MNKTPANIAGAVVLIVGGYFVYQRLEQPPAPPYTNAQVSDWCRGGINAVVSHVGGGNEELNALNAFMEIADGLNLVNCVTAIRSYEAGNP